MGVSASEALLARARTKVVEIEERFWRGATRGDRFADAVAKRVGSWPFILGQSTLLVFWMVWNTLPGTHHFDPAPFIGLNLMLSFQAAYTAPFIMMSQNRSSAKDRSYAESDFITNEVAGSEIQEMHDHLDELLQGAQVRLAMMEQQGNTLTRLEAMDIKLVQQSEALARLEAMEHRQLRLETMLQKLLTRLAEQQT